MTHRNQLRTRAQLEDSLYAWGAEVESNTVEVYPSPRASWQRFHPHRARFRLSARREGRPGDGRRGSARMNGTLLGPKPRSLAPPAAPAGLARDAADLRPRRGIVLPPGAPRRAGADGRPDDEDRALLPFRHGESAHLATLTESMAALRGIRSRRNEMALEFIIARRDGSVLSRSKHAPETRSATSSATRRLITTANPGAASSWKPDGNYRVLVGTVGQPARQGGAGDRDQTVLPLGVLLPLLIALICFSVRRGLKPLDDLASDVSARSPENLTPLAPTTPMQETQPLVRALNRLLNRLETALDNERRFTADAAHELRTPLAALKIHAQVAMATSEPAQCKQAVTKVIAGADRATRLVEQLLRLARLDPLAQPAGSAAREPR